MSHDHSERTRALNDRLRLRPREGEMVATAGVAAMGALFVVAACALIGAFDDFTPDNDPYGEHDFGEITLAGEKLFWKIDYYDLDRKRGSPHPWDDKETRRVMTIMLAEEY